MGGPWTQTVGARKCGVEVDVATVVPRIGSHPPDPARRRAALAGQAQEQPGGELSGLGPKCRIGGVGHVREERGHQVRILSSEAFDHLLVELAHLGRGFIEAAMLLTHLLATVRATGRFLDGLAGIIPGQDSAPALLLMER